MTGHLASRRVAYSEPEQPARRRCRCGTLIARDNKGALCSPCEARETDRRVAFEQSEEQRELRMLKNQRIMRNKLKEWEVPIPSEEDILDPATLRRLVYHFARCGDLRTTARRAGLSEPRALLALRRPAARDMIEFMVEEGTWPEGSPTEISSERTPSRIK